MNKSYWYRLLPVGIVTLCLLLPVTALAQGGDDEGTPATPPVQVTGSFNVERLIDDMRSASLIPDELYDPAFERYVDLELLGQAWNEKDPALLTDIALQLAEGERILLRSHKTISADKLLEIAVRAATEKNDKTTLDRLAKAIKKGGNEKLKAQLATGSKLGGESRAVDPMTMVSVHEMTPEAYTTYHNLVNQVQAARIGNSRSLLDDLGQEVENTSEISGQQREYLLKMISNARAEIPEEAKPDPGIEALDKLSQGTRGIGFRTFIPPRVDPFAGRWPKVGGNSGVVNNRTKYNKYQATFRIYNRTPNSLTAYCYGIKTSETKKDYVGHYIRKEIRPWKSKTFKRIGNDDLPLIVVRNRFGSLAEKRVKNNREYEVKKSDKHLRVINTGRPWTREPRVYLFNEP